MTRLQRLQAAVGRLYRRYYYFWLVFFLFLTFRLFALVLLRPGGYILNSSDYDYYQYVIGELSVRGYSPNYNMITAYPPLFPPLATGIYWLAARLPFWSDPRLIYHTFLGLVLLVFETGNFVVIADLARRLAEDEEGEPVFPPAPAPGLTPGQIKALLPPLIYASLFAPLYTWLGWFESMPLFFMLLGLDLLLVTGRNRGWLLSAVSAALGTLAKLTPALLAPIAVRWLGARLNWRAVRAEWFRPRAAGNLRRPALYVAVFSVTTLVIGYLLVRRNPSLALSSLRDLNNRQPWETIWALMVGYYGFGRLAVDERDPAGLAQPTWHDPLPWPLITLAFGVLFWWLYTRPYDWRRPRTLVAFTAVSFIWLFLYSRGWSPQYQVWVLAFIVLLMPSLAGAGLAVLLSFINYVEAHVYINILSGQYWLLWCTVILRTLLLLALGILFLVQIWPQPALAVRWARLGKRMATGIAGLTLLGALVATPWLVRAYWQQETVWNPCGNAVAFLNDQASGPGRAIATGQMEAWQNLYPWLRQDYRFVVLDDYSHNQDPRQIAETRLLALAQGHNGMFWWVEQSGQDPRRALAQAFFARRDVQRIATGVTGACRVTLVLVGPNAPAVPLR